jgi:selenocysteine-specific elongation factor
VGTSQVNGTISLLDRESLDPGDTAPAQIRLDQYVVCLGGDHIVLRGFELLETYGKTLGGGVIRHPLPTRARRNDATVLASMEALRGDYLPARIKHCALLTGQQGVTVAALKQVINATGKSTQQALDELLEAEELYRYVQDGTDVLLHHEVFEQLLSKALTTLQEYHGRYAHRAGMPREELRSQIRNSLPPRLFQKLVQVLSARDEIVIADTVLQKAGFVPTLSDTLQQLRADVLAEIKRGRLEPVPPDELRTRFSDRPNVSAQDVNEVLVLLAAEGHIIRVLERLIFAREHIEKLERDVVDFIRKNGQMTTPQLKEITGTSRKYTVPLAEYLDARKLTIRVGDARKLRQG